MCALWRRWRPRCKPRVRARYNFISQKVFIKSSRKSQFPHKSVNLSYKFVNLSFVITNIESKLADLCGK